jgi:hypothetical protein
MVAKVEKETSQEVELPKHYCLDESDSDVVVLRRDGGAFVAAFSARGATKEGLVEAAREDYASLIRQTAQAPDARRC